MLEYSKPKTRGFRYLTAVSLIFLILGLVPTAYAGIGTSPGDAGKLEAVANNLDSINDRINMVLGFPPDPFMPGDIGQVNQFLAMERELDVLYGRVNAVLGLPPDPCDPSVIAALTDVRDGSQAIVTTVDEAITNTMPPILKEALEGVRDRAQSIVDLANENLPVPG